jgi:hypothetical protein
MVLARWAGRRSDDNASTQQQIGNLPGRGSKGVIECRAGETTRQLLIGFVSNLHEARWPADARLEPGEAEPQPCPRGGVRSGRFRYCSHYRVVVMCCV